ncbi:MAG: putative iron-sulfur cluster assembly accessory protein [Propionibacteriaceae bacterium]|jgi:iron-sulfur cluster assembly accessory protein|nr:putative iron-sulfur cluster assembly accessory protein [Propionibacteriaceae bacterium]
MALLRTQNPLIGGASRDERDEQAIFSARESSDGRFAAVVRPLRLSLLGKADNIQEFDMTATDQTFVEAPTVAHGVILTDEAAGKVKALLEGEGRDDLSLRVAVQPGGCSGLRYQLFFDERSLEGDVVKDFGGVSVVTDRMSAPYLMGATIDFVDTIEKQGFTIDNPNATGSCACGDSFH